MRWIELAKQFSGVSHNKTLTNRHGAVRVTMIDALESRSLLSASVSTATAGNTASAAQTQFQVLALKASVTSVKLSSATTSVGASVTITALVAGKSSTGIPSGTVTFKAGKTVLGTATLNASGIAKLATTAIPVGTSLVTAVYSGSSRFAISTSAARGHVVTGLATTTKLSVSTTAMNLGDAVNLVAHVAPVSGTAVATGRVVFYDGSAVIGSHTLNSIGAARINTNYLYVGTHSLKAVYQGSTKLASHRSSVRTVTVATPSVSTQSDGLVVGTITAGGGVGAATGDILTVNYVLYLAATGKEIETSYGSGQTYTFQLGVSNVIQGWQEGLVGVRQGERRVLVVPPSLGYGSSASGNVPANATTVFTIDVISITQT